MAKFDRSTQKMHASQMMRPISQRQEQFWQEQELIKHDNKCLDKRLFWAEAARQDDLERAHKQREDHIRQKRRKAEDNEIGKELSKIRSDRKILIREAFIIIQPHPGRWRECYREIIYELASIRLSRSSTVRWTKEDHSAAIKVIKALKKARNEARSLPDWESGQILFPLEELLSRIEHFTEEPFGKRRSAADKRGAVSSAFALLSTFRERPTTTTKNSALYKLASKLAGDDAGMDHHCRDFFHRANRV